MSSPMLKERAEGRSVESGSQSSRRRQSRAPRRHQPHRFDATPRPRPFFYEFAAGAHAQLASYDSASDSARASTGRFLDAPGRRPDSAGMASVAPFDFAAPSFWATHAATAS